MDTDPAKDMGSERKRPSSRKGAARKTRKKRFSQHLFRDWCKACGICNAFCPKGVIGRDNEGKPLFLKPDDCIGCRFCELHCPDFAITIVERNTRQEDKAS